MNISSKKDPPPQIGSNLRRRNRDALRAHRAKLRANQTRLYQQKVQAFIRRCKKIVSKAEFRIATEIVRGVKNEFALASFAAGRDCAKRDALKAAAQKKLNRLLAKALPSFSKLEDLKAAYLLELAEISEAVFYDPATDGLTVHYGDTVDGGGQDPEAFVAPFPLFDTGAEDSDGLIDHGNSFVYPTFSEVGNGLFFKHNEDSFTFNPLFITFARLKSASSFASCGINYTMPKTGHLQISALLDAIANRVTYSVTDNFGLSYGMVDVRVLLFISVIRGGNVSHLTRTLLSNGLISQGSDLSYTMPTLMNTAPYLVNGSTNEIFSAGDSVQILVGTEVQVDSELDDMESKVNAFMLWRLQKISVAIF